MMLIPILLIAGCVAETPLVEAKESLVAEDGITKLPGEFRFTEGPVWTKKGTLVFSDIPANKLYEFKGGKMNVLDEDSENANGNTIDKEGNLWTCHHGSRRVTKTLLNGEVEVVADKFGDKKLNSPNDLVLLSNGWLFFTDPSFGIRQEQMEYGEKGVFMVKDGKVTKVMTGRNQPNGVVASPDEKYLYVADSSGGKIDVLTITANGVGARALLCEVPGPDGIRVDKKGRIWAACRDGVRIISPDGDTLETIPIPEVPANLCFGEDGSVLFVTARRGVYRVQTEVGGVMPGF